MLGTKHSSVMQILRFIQILSERLSQYNLVTNA